MFNKFSTSGAYMSKKRWWWWSILGLIGLYLLLIATRCTPIEKDIQTRTEAALTEKGHDWATVTLDGRGRDIMLSGIAPSEAARTEAVETATGIYGARVVEHGITIKEYSTPVFGLNNEDGKTILSGSLPEQGLIDDGATLSGTFHTDEEKQVFAKLAGDNLTGKLTDSSVVVPLGPTPEELAEIARKAEEAEAARIAEEKRLAAETEVAHMAEEAKLVAEASKLAEEKRLAAMAAALVADTAATKMVEEKRLAAEAAAAKMTETQRLAEKAAIELRLENEERLRVEEENRVLAEMRAVELAESQHLQAEVTSCQSKLNGAMNGNSILFATSSSTINSKSYPLLDIITLTARQCSEVITSNAKSIEISGHTDSRGADEMNLNLSENRAKSVRDYLLGKGVRSSVLISKGYGEANPVATNDTAAGRQKNRRIQFTIQ